MGTTTSLLLVSGSLRERSTNTAVLRTALAVLPQAAVANLFDGMGHLPHFNPDDDTDHPPASVVDLRSAVRSADAVLLSIPEYAGAMPGSFKNLLDWTIGDDQAGSIYEKPVAWINASPRGAANAHDSLRKVLGYAHADIVEPACADIPVTAAMIDDAGLIVEGSTQDGISEAVAALVDHVQRLHGAR